MVFCRILVGGKSWFTFNDHEITNHGLCSIKKKGGRGGGGEGGIFIVFHTEIKEKRGVKNILDGGGEKGNN